MFAAPSYLHALWLLPVLVVLRLLAQARAEKTADSFVAQRLRGLLIASRPPFMAWLVFSLQLLAFAGFILALAQPRWDEEKRLITESGKNIIIALDTSKSMLADDVQPNRLMKAKLASQDLIGTLRDQRVGLIAFAGTAYLQAPLTTDHDAVVESLQNFDTFTIPRGGSIISTAVREALTAVEKTQARNHGLIIFSDGAENDPDLDAMLAKAKEKKIIIITVGVGTETGALIPNPDPESPGDYVRDPETGAPVHSRIEEATLRKIADATGGAYVRLNGQTVGSSVVTQVLNTLESKESGSREEIKPKEKFYWPLGLGMFCLMLSLFLRPASRISGLAAPAAVAALLLTAPVQSQAAVLSNRQMIEEAQHAYRDGNFTRARDVYAELLAEDPPPGRAEELAYGLGAASGQLKDYDRAVDAFSRALRSPHTDTQARAHHSLGNTLYEQGAKALQQQPDYTVRAWLDSVSHYESALAIRDDQTVRENMEFVKKQLEQLKQQQQQQQQQQEQSKDGKKKQEKGEKGQKGDKNEESEEEEGDQSEKSEKSEKKDGQKEGDQKDGKGEKGEQQDGKQGEGEQAENKPGEQQIPEGQIEAGKEGKLSEKQMRELIERALAEEKPDDKTGFSRNEARNLLRAYSDQMQLQFQRRSNDRTTKRDW